MCAEQASLSHVFSMMETSRKDIWDVFDSPSRRMGVVGMVLGNALQSRCTGVVEICE